ncbi:MAG TPA: hypothetical protein VGM83_07800 [Devosiaceae bacterium]
MPVTVVTGGDRLPVIAGARTVVIEDAGDHEHASTECLVCNTRGDVRTLLFELQERVRLGDITDYAAVIVDARKAQNPQEVVDRLIPGRLPAFGLRDHAVARNFHLENVVGR